MAALKQPFVSYSSYCREERFYCALLASRLLTDSNSLSSFLEILHVPASEASQTDETQIYLEAAPLRDYWYYLGSQRKGALGKAVKGTKSAYNPCRAEFLTDLINSLAFTDDGKLKLKAIFSSKEKTENLPSDWVRFWTMSKDGRPSSLVTPGKWSIPSLGEDSKSARKPDETEIRAEDWKLLRQLRYAFNAQPDFIILHGDTLFVIEAKIESKVDSRNHYNQVVSQALIAELAIKHKLLGCRQINHIVPYILSARKEDPDVKMANKLLKHTVLAKSSITGECRLLSWDEVIAKVLPSPQQRNKPPDERCSKSFAVECLRELGKRLAK